MTKVGQYNGDVPPKKTTTTPQTSSTTSNYQNAFEAWQKQQQAEFEAFQQQQNGKFEGFQQQNAEYNSFQENMYSQYENFTRSNTQGSNTVQASGQYNLSEYSTGAPEGTMLVAQPAKQAPTTGGIYAEYDKDTGNSITYNRNDNTITTRNSSGEIISVTDFDGKPITPESEPAKTTQPATTTTQTDQNQATSSSNEKKHVADFMEGISNETKEYLKNNEDFTAKSDEYINLAFEKNELQSKLASAKEALQNAKTTFDNTSYSDYDAKSVAQENYYNAMSNVKDLQNQIMGIERSQKILMKNMLEYTQTIENWQDGNQVEHTSSGTGIGVQQRVYTCITLPNGEKGYEWNGKQFPLAPNGMPAPEYKPEIHDSIVF